MKNGANSLIFKENGFLWKGMQSLYFFKKREFCEKVCNHFEFQENGF